MVEQEKRPVIQSPEIWPVIQFFTIVNFSCWTIKPVKFWPGWFYGQLVKKLAGFMVEQEKMASHSVVQKYGQFYDCHFFLLNHKTSQLLTWLVLWPASKKLAGFMVQQEKMDGHSVVQKYGQLSGFMIATFCPEIWPVVRFYDFRFKFQQNWKKWPIFPPQP